MNTIMTKVLMIIVLALVGSLGHAAGVQAKPDTAKQMNRAGPPSWDNMTEDRLKQMIVQEAAKTTNVTPSVALAVAKIESDFRPHVVSSAGAIGVMQIMPRTGHDLFGLSRAELFDPAINIRAGVTFLDQLIDRYGGRVDLALSHYNGGSRVNAGSQPKIIPVTRGYVIKVLAAAQAYQAEGRDINIDAPSDRGVRVAEHSLPPSAGTATVATYIIPVEAGSQLNDPSTRALHRHLKEADFWMEAAQATSNAGMLSTGHTDAGTGPASTLVANLRDNRQAFRRWLKATR
jgi:hypothetical protein